MLGKWLFFICVLLGNMREAAGRPIHIGAEVMVRGPISSLQDWDQTGCPLAFHGAWFCGHLARVNRAREFSNVCLLHAENVEVLEIHADNNHRAKAKITRAIQFMTLEEIYKEKGGNKRFNGSLALGINANALFLFPVRVERRLKISSSCTIYDRGVPHKMVRWRLTAIGSDDLHTREGAFAKKFHRSVLYPDISANLRFANFAGDSVGLASLPKVPDQKRGPSETQNRCDPRGRYLFFGGLGSPYLGVRIFCIMLVGFGFTLLSVCGVGRALDDLDRKRRARS